MATFPQLVPRIGPAWWVIRGWLVGSFLSTVGNNNTLGGPRLMPRFGLELLLTLAITVLSVQWGRGRWFVWPWLRRLATVMSILAVWFGLVFALNGSTTSWGGPRDWDTGYYQGQQDALRLVNGVWVNGEPVINIFAYDAAGNPIPVVQLFDERGRPISLRNSEDDGGGYLDASTGQFWRRLPRSSADGRLWWNTFPQIEVPEDQLTWDDEGNRLPLSAGQAREPQWPFLRATRVDSGRDVDDFSPIGG